MTRWTVPVPIPNNYDYTTNYLIRPPYDIEGICTVQFYMEEPQPDDDCAILWAIEEIDTESGFYEPVIKYNKMKLNKEELLIQEFSFTVKPGKGYRYYRQFDSDLDAAVGNAIVISAFLEYDA